MGCGTGCLKVVLIVFNILFWIFGLGVLGVGVWMKVDRQIANIGVTLDIGSSNFNAIELVAWVFIGAGIFAFVVGFFGCCGAITESRCLLGFYLVCLVLIFAAQIAAAVFGGIRFGEIKDKITVAGADFVKKDYDGESVVSKGFNYVQLEFCCCGFQNFLDYKDSKFVNDSKSGIKQGHYMSFACCQKSAVQPSAESTNIEPEDKEKCEAAALTLSNQLGNATNPQIPDTTCESSFRAGGCTDAVVDWATERLPIFFGVASGVAFVQIVIFILALLMCIYIGRDEKD